MPGGPGTGLERDTGAERAGWIICLEQGVNTYRADKILGGSLPEGCEPHLLMSISLSNVPTQPTSVRLAEPI
jgi:hypothetical protein